MIVALGSFAHGVVASLLGMRPRPASGTGPRRRWLTGGGSLGSYHPSQQNTFTGKLTEEMLDAVFARARELTDDS